MAALVCAIVGLLVPPAEILAIIFGHIGRSQVRRTGESGAGMALAGLIVGYIVLSFFILGTVAAFALSSVMGPATPGSTSGAGMVIPG